MNLKIPPLNLFPLTPINNNDRRNFNFYMHSLISCNFKTSSWKKLIGQKKKTRTWIFAYERGHFKE